MEYGEMPELIVPRTRRVGDKVKPTSEYAAWTTMRQRCRDVNHRYYADYGGRGITVCERWRDSYEAFAADMGPKPTPKHSIDRIDNDGNYEPGNCRWATQTEQRRNTRFTAKVEYGGEVRILAELCEELGVDLELIRKRIFLHGWPPERAFATPRLRHHLPRGKHHM